MTSIPRRSYADTPPDFHLISQNSENNDEEQGGSEYGGGLILTKGITNCNFASLRLDFPCSTTLRHKSANEQSKYTKKPIPGLHWLLMS